MEVRHATPDDIPAIVDLLKLSLGEQLMPKSEEFWRWKHLQNPFGESPVLLAFDQDTLTGVRAFMHWRWSTNTNTYSAVRAVDTATHPEYQGRGIFRTLTQKLVGQCTGEGIDFIFNTPNSKSKQGYLKLGWHLYGRLRIGIAPVFTFRSAISDFALKYPFSIPVELNRFVRNTDEVRSQLSEAYLSWRYGANPNVSYHSFSDEGRGEYYTVFRLKNSRAGLEFRICDSFFTEAASMKVYSAHLNKVAKEAGARFITWASADKGIRGINLALGPEITIRPLSANGNSLPFGNWRPALGDLEVF